MCCEVLLIDFQANYFVMDLQGNFVASSLLISNGFFFQRWVLDLCCGNLFYFSFIVQGANVMCGRWVVF